jgi:hypothetical protein
MDNPGRLPGILNLEVTLCKVARTNKCGVLSSPIVYSDGF